MSKKFAAVGVATVLAASLMAVVPAQAATKSYTIATVKAHKSAASCWSAVNGKVYNLTKWISKHPGGASVIKSMCGKDATAAFKSQHGLSGRPASTLASYKIGTLKKRTASATPTATPIATTTPTPTPSTTTLSLALVATHATSTDCWSIVNNNVYNLTSWIALHPGGTGVIQGMCGKDASTAYSGQHGNKSKPAGKLAGYLIGAVGTPAP